MWAHPRGKALAAVWLLFLTLLAPTTLHARSASRGLRYLLHRNGVVPRDNGLDKLQHSRNHGKRQAVIDGKLPGSVPGQNPRSIVFLLDAEHAEGQHRLLPGKGGGSKKSKGTKSSSKGSDGKGNGKGSDGKGKGKGKGKGASKKCKSSKGKGGDRESCEEDILPGFCDSLDFRVGVGRIPAPEVYGDFGAQSY